MVNKVVIAWAMVGVSAVASVAAVIFAKKSEKRVSEICDKLDVAMDELMENTEIEVSDEIIEEAISMAANRYAREAVKTINTDVLKGVKDEIATEVRKAVDMAYANLKIDVKEELERQIRNIDISGIKKQVIEEASEKAKEKFSVELDSIAARFSSDLESSSKIYKTIAEKLGS